MSDFKDKLREYFGMDPDELPLSPLDGAMRGVTKLGERAGAYLAPLGAKLDAKLGTAPNDNTDPLVKSALGAGRKLLGLPQQDMGTFESVGALGPPVVAFAAGNKLPMGGASGSGVSAFPTPKQSLKAMQDEAVLRDALEAKGARAIEPPREITGKDLFATSERQKRLQEALAGGVLKKDGTPNPPSAPPSIYDSLGRGSAASDFNARRDGQGLRDESFGRVAPHADAAARSPQRQFEALDAPDPNAVVSAEQTALEKYLAELYGPKAK